LFLREYGIIIVLRLIIRLVLMGRIGMMGIAYIGVILFLRRCYPRIRYDVIITIMWEMVLPLSVFVFLIFRFFK
jgi:NADH:ubiquinone oxidoreductase subunit H